MGVQDKPHKKLECWKRSIDFVGKIYLITINFPLEERFGLVSQLRRASVSIPANIAEGAGRKSSKEFINFLSISTGSLAEVDTLLIIAAKLGYISKDKADELLEELDFIGKLIYGLSSKLKQSNFQ